jgi:hypothetical protein
MGGTDLTPSVCDGRPSPVGEGGVLRKRRFRRSRSRHFPLQPGKGPGTGDLPTAAESLDMVIWDT